MSRCGSPTFQEIAWSFFPTIRLVLELLGLISWSNQACPISTRHAHGSSALVSEAAVQMDEHRGFPWLAHSRIALVRRCGENISSMLSSVKPEDPNIQRPSGRLSLEGRSRLIEGALPVVACA